MSLESWLSDKTFRASSLVWAPFPTTEPFGLRPDHGSNLLSGQTHSWINDVLGSMSQASISDTLTRFPILGKVWLLFNQTWAAQLMEAATRHQQYTIKLTTQ